ncbi:MAG: N-acetyltransferase [Alphaproteobacteria bacterium]|nr:N-acetyltransferase [Alphaproteobacteria bacterium]
MIRVRDFYQDDFPRIQQIFRQGIATGNATFSTEVKDWDQWDRDYCRDCRLVLEAAGRVMGYAVISPLSTMPAYGGMVEDSLYIDRALWGKGAGNLLLAALVEATEKAGYWTLHARIFPENNASIALHKSHGFRLVGTLERPGQLNGIWRDVVLMERRSKVI